MKQFVDYTGMNNLSAFSTSAFNLKLTTQEIGGGHF